MISKNFKKNQNVRCYNCDKQVHLQRDCRQGILETIFFFSGDIPNRKSQPSGVCRRCGKGGEGQRWTNECRATRDRQGNPFPLGNALVSLSQPRVKFGSIIPCQHWGNSSTEQLKDLIPVVKNHTALDVVKDRTTSIEQ